MYIYCTCDSLKSRIITKAIDNIVKSAEYTSDFRISDLPKVYENEWVSIDTVSKYYVEDVTESSKVLEKDTLLSLREQYVQADSYKKSFAKVFIDILENNDSPADCADEKYNAHVENKDKYEYKALTRGQKDMFGYKCEYVEVEYFENPEYAPINQKYDTYYFRKGKYLYTITAKYNKYTPENDIMEMLDGITIKDK